MGTGWATARLGLAVRHRWLGREASARGGRSDGDDGAIDAPPHVDPLPRSEAGRDHEVTWKSLTDAAKELGISPETLRRALVRGETPRGLAVVRVGRAW